MQRNQSNPTKIDDDYEHLINIYIKVLNETIELQNKLFIAESLLSNNQKKKHKELCLRIN